MEDDEVTGSDPTGRYIKFASELGRGAYKIVYKAIDRDLGIEVAWNEIRVDKGADFDKLWKEITILQQLSHPNVLVCHNAWLDEKNLYVAFITECMTSGTLRQFMKKAKSVKLRVIKNWCIQILEGLNYLHTRDPPIIHRDIKCDNIFINGNSGQVKIGDLGLATNIVSYASTTKLSIIGTPEFMAPEYYDEDYNEKVDIWAFGMCILEMATHEYPYSECTNPAQIFKKVMSGDKPQSLEKLKSIDLEVYNFIEECLHPVETRKSAAKLLEHPFLTIDEISNNRSLEFSSDQISPTVNKLSKQPSPSSLTKPSDPSSSKFPIEINDEPSSEIVNKRSSVNLETTSDEPKTPPQSLQALDDILRNNKNTGSHRFHTPHDHNDESNEHQRLSNSIHPLYDSKIKSINVGYSSDQQYQADMNITVITPIENTSNPAIINLSLTLALGKQVSHIEFDYNIEFDTPVEVAKEMVREFELSESNVTLISEYIDAKVLEYRQHIKPKSPQQILKITKDLENAKPIVRSSSHQPISVRRKNSGNTLESPRSQDMSDIDRSCFESVNLEDEETNDTFPLSERTSKKGDEVQDFKLIAETNNASCDAALKAFELDMKELCETKVEVDNTICDDALKGFEQDMKELCETKAIVRNEQMESGTIV